MDLLMEKVHFERTNSQDAKQGSHISLYQANNKDIVYRAKVEKEIVTISLHLEEETKNHINEPFYVFKYDMNAKKEINRYTENLPNLWRWDTYQCHMVNHQMIEQFMSALEKEKELEEKKIKERKERRQKEFLEQEKKELERKHKQEAQKRKQEQEKKREDYLSEIGKMVERKSPLLDMAHLKMIDSIVTKKETILGSVHLLDKSEREIFIRTWTYFDDLMDLSEQLMMAYTTKEQTSILRGIHSIHDRMRVLHDKSIVLRQKPKENIEISMLSQEVEQLKEQVLKSSLFDDYVTAHQYATVMRDYSHLMELYQEAKPENRMHLETDVIAGLTEVVTKLKPFASKLLRNEKRSVERQVLVLGERYIETK